MPQSAFARIIRDQRLSSARKGHALALAAKNSLPAPAVDPETRAALDARIICNMYEGHAPSSRAMCGPTMAC